MKPRLLFLCQLLPYPPDGGAPIRTYNILRLLAEHYEVTLLCFYRRPVLRNLPGSLQALGSLATTTAYRIEQEYDRFRMILDHLRSLVTGRVYTEFVYESADFRRALRQTLASHQFDLVHVDSLDLSGYLDELGDLPTVCVHHNVESVLLARRSTLAGNRALRWYMRHQATLMQKTERAWAPRLALNVMVSPADAKLLHEIAPTANALVVPNGVDTEAFVPGAPQRTSGIIYVGGLNWFPNRDALDHLVEDVLPHLRAMGVDESISWIGHATDEEKERFARSGIQLRGYVDDIRPHVHAAACFIVPMRVGGGTRLKILDAWAMGKAVVSTSVGCEGLDTKDGENILIRDDPRQFAEAVQRVLVDEDLRNRLGHGARATVERTYAWPIIGGHMMRAYRALTAGADSHAGLGTGSKAAVQFDMS